MIRPTSGERTALRDLPPEAQVALEACAGPGWSVADDASGVSDLYPENPWPEGRRGRLWLPVDTAEILAVVRTKTGRLVQLEAHPAPPHWLAWVPDGDEDWNASLSTPRGAALILLAAVYR